MKFWGLDGVRSAVVDLVLLNSTTPTLHFWRMLMQIMMHLHHSTGWKFAKSTEWLMILLIETESLPWGCFSG